MTTADRLRHEIDQGRTGDKVRVQDPAAAPLGTDDEVGSHPHTAPATQDNYPRNQDGGGRMMFWGLLLGAAVLSALFIAVV